MAQDENKNVAERDAKFLADHPVEGNVVRLGAGFTGAHEAISKGVDETKDFLSQTIKPGDMSLANMPHPLDDFKEGIAKIVDSGDMKISNAPHPVDKAIAVATSKLEEIDNAGVFEGTRIGSAIAVGAMIDSIGPKGKVKVAGEMLEGVGNGAKELHIANHVKDDLQAMATNAFLHEATERTGKQLFKAMEEYDRTARVAKTYGEKFVGDEAHEKALVRFEIAAIKQDALVHGGDASINNPVIADLTKNGITSDHFYANNIINALKKYTANPTANYEETAVNIALQATKQAHTERLKFLVDAEAQGKALSPHQMLELSVGKQYGPDAGAYARELANANELSKVRDIFPDQNQSNTKSTDGNLSSMDVIKHLTHPDAQAIVLARIQEQKEAVNQRSAGIELS